MPRRGVRKQNPTLPTEQLQTPQLRSTIVASFYPPGCT
jgi:hypothetical protein